MKKLILLCAIIFLITGCQNSKNVDTSEKKEPKQTAQQEEKQEEATVISEDPKIEEQAEPIVVEEQPSIFNVKDNKYYVHGITLGDDLQTVINTLGNPQKEEYDESGYNDTILSYDDYTVGIANGAVGVIRLDMDMNVFADEFGGKFSEDKYVDEESNVIYFFQKETEHLFFAKEDGVFLGYADGNFYYWLEEGAIAQVE